MGVCRDIANVMLRKPFMLGQRIVRRVAFFTVPGICDFA